MIAFRTLRFIAISSVLAAGLAWHAGFDAPAADASGQRSTAKSAAAFTARADLADRQSRCGVQDLLGAEEEAVERALNASRAADPKGTITVPVYWHIITRTSPTIEDVSSLVPAQMAVLATAYASSGFAFEFQGLEVVANDDWFFAEAGSPEEVEMKASLRQGGPQALNIYTTNGDIYLGWATFPFNYRFFPSYDGVVLWWAALPGTGLAGAHPDEPDGILTYDQGDTGTHEVGHWLGLYHTFQGGCSHPGDRIKDTPAEAEPQFFCAARDSCLGPVFPGADPITNFMDYVDDVCMDNFTAEQTKRMRKQWGAFRNKKAGS